MSPRFLADADVNQKILTGLRRKAPSLDLLTAHQGGVVGIADPDVLAAAAAQGRILISHDRRTMPGHFARFIARQRSPGLIIVDQNLDIGSAIEDLLLLWESTDTVFWLNQIGFVPV